MIDLVGLRAIAEGGDDEDRLPITRRMVRQLVRELEQGRAATAARYGQQQLDAVLDNIRYERPIGERVCIDIGENA